MDSKALWDLNTEIYFIPIIIPSVSTFTQVRGERLTRLLEGAGSTFVCPLDMSSNLRFNILFKHTSLEHVDRGAGDQMTQPEIKTSQRCLMHSNRLSLLYHCQKLKRYKIQCITGAHLLFQFIYQFISVTDQTPTQKLKCFKC